MRDNPIRDDDRFEQEREQTEMTHTGCNLPVDKCPTCAPEEDREPVNTAPICGPCSHGECVVCQGCYHSHYPG